MNLSERVGKLEEKNGVTEAQRPWHRMLGESKSECEAQRAALIASGKATADDNFTFRVIVNWTAPDDDRDTRAGQRR
jgi:hypothetical protein